MDPVRSVAMDGARLEDFMSVIARAKLRTQPLLLAVVAVTAVLVAVPARADITVGVDRAQVLRVSRPADVVIIGNPAIADATVQDSQTLVITGKSFGSTNIIILDATGQSIAEDVVTVTQPNDVVTVYRRDNRTTYSCTPECSPTLSIGDSDSTFAAVNSQIQAHGDLSAKQ
jgi:Flp pilus assembly secretin CpaC